MRCPICNNPLVEDKERRFETLADHVSEPNILLRPLRMTWVCKDTECPLGTILVFWDWYGDYYYTNRFHSFYTSEGIMKKLEYIAYQNTLLARNSRSRKFNREHFHEDRRIHLFRIGKFKWEVHRKYICNDDGKIVRRRFKIQRFKKHELGWVWS